MRSFRLMLVAAGILSAIIYSCSKDEKDASTLSSSKKSAILSGQFPNFYCNQTPEQFCLIAGQTINSGSVSIVNDGTNLYIKFDASGTTLSEVHVWIGEDLDNAPVNKQNTPVPGQFPYKLENINQSSATLVIPLTEVPDDCFYILAHAALANGETAWGANCSADQRLTFDEYFGTSRWGFIVQYCPAECVDKYIALKVRYTDANGITKSGMMAGMQGYFKKDWCTYLGVNKVESKTFDLVSSYNIKIGSVTIVKNASDFSVSITLDAPGSTIVKSYLFYGTLQQLDSYIDPSCVICNGCPQFTNFPYPVSGAPSQSSFTVPL